MPQTNEQPKDQFCFELGQFAVEQSVEGKKKRTFSGIAYSGEPIVDHWYWDRIIFDLDSLQIKGVFLHYLSIVQASAQGQLTLTRLVTKKV